MMSAKASESELSDIVILVVRRCFDPLRLHLRLKEFPTSCAWFRLGLFQVNEFWKYRWRKVVKLFRRVALQKKDAKNLPANSEWAFVLIVSLCTFDFSLSS